MTNSTISAIEELMNEFNSYNTSNIRKREIENQLQTFKNSNDSWQYCLHGLPNCTNAYVWMFAASTVEDVIARRWRFLSKVETNQIKEILWKNFTAISGNPQRFQINKLAKLISDIAKRDLPTEWPDFFDKLLELIKSPQCMLGVVLLRVCSEEMINRNDMYSKKRQEHEVLLTAYMDRVFAVISQLLHAIVSRGLPGHTPPSSPNSHNISESVLNTIISRDETFIRELTFELLCTVQHLFSYVVLTDHVNSSLLSTLFLLADATNQRTESLCTVALSVINELLYRKCVLADVPVLLCGQIMQLLYRLNCYNNEDNGIITDSYLEKLTELLKLFVSQHYGRMIREPNFDSMQFLSLVYQYTFKVNYHSVEGYLGCLEVWLILIEHVKKSNSTSYTEALLGISTSCFNSVLFSSNEALLNSIDNSTLDDDMLTDWQHFVQQCFELLSTTAELLPLQIINMLVDPWKSLLNMYTQLENAIDVNTQSLQINEREYNHVHNVLRDLSTVTQGLGRLSNVVTGNELTDHGQVQLVVQNIVTKSIEYCHFANRLDLYRLKSSYDPVKTDLEQVQANMLATLSSYIPWLLQSNISQQTIVHLIQSALGPLKNRQRKNIAPVLPINNDSTLMLNRTSSALLLHVSSILRPKEFLSHDDINSLLNSDLDEETILTIHKSVINNLVLRWNPNTMQQNSVIRTVQLGQYVANLSQDYLNISENELQSAEENVVLKVTNCLLTHEGILEYYKEESSLVKDVLRSAYEPLLEQALLLVSRFGLNGPISEPVMSFCLSCFTTLQHKVGPAFTKRAVSEFINAANREQLSSAKLNAVAKLIKILHLVILLPGNAYKCFITDIISLALDHVAPILTPSEDAECHDAVLSLLGLFDAILQNKWQYFYRSQVLLGNSPLQSEMSEELQNVNQLESILLAYGRGLIGGDLSVFQACLQSLDKLNDKWRLYHKMFFRQDLLSRFLRALLTALLDNQHALLSDEIMLAVFNMASVDINGFYTDFLPQFLREQNLLEIWHIDLMISYFDNITDQPTFMQVLTDMIKEMKYHKLTSMKQ